LITGQQRTDQRFFPEVPADRVTESIQTCLLPAVLCELP
jgi:hypothetical protein